MLKAVRVLPNWISTGTYIARTLTFQNMHRDVCNIITSQLQGVDQTELNVLVSQYLEKLAGEHEFMPLKENIPSVYLQWKEQWYPVELEGDLTRVKGPKPESNSVLLARLLSVKLKMYDQRMVRSAVNGTIKLLEKEYGLMVAPAEVYGGIMEDPVLNKVISGAFVWQQRLHHFTVDLKSAGGLRQLW